MVGTAPNSADFVAYWKLTDNTDATGNGNTLTVTTPTSGGTGIVGDCYTFDGNDALIASDSSGQFDLNKTDGFSIGGWINMNSINGENMIIAKDSRVNERAWTLVYETSGGGNFRFYSQGGLWSIQATSAGAASTGSWYFVVGTYNGTNAKIYVGKAGTIYTNTIAASTEVPTGTSTVQIGAREYDTVRSFSNARIDEVFVANTALTDDNIIYLYNLGSPGTDQQWPFSGSPPATPTDDANFQGCNF